MRLRVAALVLAFSVAVVAAMASPAQASEAEAAHARAVQAYEQHRYDEAADGFRLLIAEHGPHPAALLGLGNASYRMGDWVGAVYAYEWGLRLKPGDAALRENLGIARTHLVADVFPSAQAESAARAWEILSRVRGRLTLVIGLALWTLGFLLLALRQRGRLEGWTWLGVALILLALPAFAHAGWQWRRLTGPQEGILQSAEVDVRSGPGEAYQQLFELHAGTVVTVKEERSGWRHVVLPSGAEGWVESRDLAVFGEVSTLSPG